MTAKLLPPLISIIFFLIILSVLLLPSRNQGIVHILPGNGWTHAETARLQWTNHGEPGPDSNWIRAEYGLPFAWLVRDEAVGGTRTYTRIAEGYLLLYIAAAGVPSLIVLIVIQNAILWKKRGSKGGK